MARRPSDGDDRFAREHGRAFASALATTRWLRGVSASHARSLVMEGSWCSLGSGGCDQAASMAMSPTGSFSAVGGCVRRAVRMLIASTDSRSRP